MNEKPEPMNELRDHDEGIRAVGGYREIKGYLAKDIAITFSGGQARYAQIPILTEYTNENSRHCDGNLGADLIKQFERMTLKSVF